MKGFYKIAILSSFVLFAAGCVPYQSLLNFSEAPGIPSQPQDITNFQPITIQPNDLLQIQISSTDPLAAQPFIALQGTGEQGGGAGTFLVNSRGEVTFPTLGRINVKGLQIEAAADTILQLLRPYFSQEPIVNVRLINFSINVNGEVNNPGIFPVRSDRVTILDALTLAGDFTSYSRRDSIMIIRERDGIRSFGYIDLNSSDAFTSPYFYLQQNDVVYVRPEKTKTNSVRDSASRFLPWISAIASLTAVAFTIFRLR